VKTTYFITFTDLLTQARELGNHHSKYINNIEQNFDELLSLLDKDNLSNQVHLLQLAPNPLREMQLIASCAADSAHQRRLLASYYALQFLLLDLKALNMLQLRLNTTANRYEVYQQFLMQTGNDFRRLTAAYMNVLLDIFLPKDLRPEFVICGVGTRVDQDDIDLGIIDAGKTERPILTAAFGKLNTEMLKNASTLHFHLSEHVGTEGYSASIADYHQLLDHSIGDCVILSEMLNAVPILGNLDLFQQFKAEILERYYYHKNGENKYHEGLLRGLLGEIRDLLYFVPSETTLNPKRDALRMIKALLFTLKTWKHIEGTTSLEVLNAIRKGNRLRREQFDQLYQALTFFESFRFLYQLFVVQEEEIVLTANEVSDNLQKIAIVMGYTDRNFVPAYKQLLVHYHDHRQLACQATAAIMEQVSHHLSQTATLALFMNRSVLEKQGNLAVKFIREARFFQGVRYWDDIMSRLANPNQILIRRFITDFSTLSPLKQQILFKTYVQWGFSSPYALITLFTLMAHNQREIKNTLFFQNFLQYFIENFPPNLETINRLYQMLNFAPKVINDFLSLLPSPLLTQLLQILEQPKVLIENERGRNTFIFLSRLYLHSSYYFRHFLQRASSTYADYLLSLDNQPKLSQMAAGLYRNLDNFESLPEKLHRLGDYYDFEFMRAGLSLIGGAAFEKVNRDFTYFSDNYLRMLFELCREEISQTLSDTEFQAWDNFAILVAGGHARRQAFDDDYDLVILLDSDEPDLLRLGERLAQKINRHILRRSIMPHYRFAERFGRYVTTFRDLTTFFEHSSPDAFIEQSLLIGARLIVGNSPFLTRFQQVIIQPYIFERNNAFCRALITEIAMRRTYYHKLAVFNIKECPGGLRDFENCLFALLAFRKWSEPISATLIARLKQVMPSISSEIEQLWQNYQWLKHIRDLYRLLVATDDQFHIDHLGEILGPLNKSRQTEFGSPLELEKAINQTTAQNVKLINAILQMLDWSI